MPAQKKLLLSRRKPPMRQAQPDGRKGFLPFRF